MNHQSTMVPAKQEKHWRDLLVAKGGLAHDKTLRDEFAMHALPTAMKEYSKESMIAEYCYSIADEMLKARKKEEGAR